MYVFDTESGQFVVIEKPDSYSEGDVGSAVLGWSLARRQAFLLAHGNGGQRLALLQVDLMTGRSTIVIEETSDTRVETNSAEYNRPNIRVINDGAEVIWYSDRSGWGHLYLYDAQTGEQKSTITHGDWLVQDIHHVDTENRTIYFTGGGRERGRDPYFRHLYKTSLDGGEVVLLTDTDADHHYEPEQSSFRAAYLGTQAQQSLIRPDLGVLIDTYSRVDQPPVTLLRSTADGTVITALETADAGPLYATGWRAPVRWAVKAADGVTDIYTVYYAPQKEIPGGRHPVIDAVYGGPQIIVAPRNFIDAYRATKTKGESGLARLGFAVVITDGRGTPLRSNAFRDIGYPEFTRVGIDGHMSAFRQLADMYPAMDTSRVGIYGWSWGGTFCILRAQASRSASGLRTARVRSTSCMARGVCRRYSMVFSFCSVSSARIRAETFIHSNGGYLWPFRSMAPVLPLVPLDIMPTNGGCPSPASRAA